MINQWENTFWNDTSRDWCVNNVWQWLVMIATWTPSYLSFVASYNNICTYMFSYHPPCPPSLSSLTLFFLFLIHMFCHMKWGYNFYTKLPNFSNSKYFPYVKVYHRRHQVYVRQAWQAYTCSLLIIILMSLGWTFDRDGWISLLIEYTHTNNIEQIVSFSSEHFWRIYIQLLFKVDFE